MLPSISASAPQPTIDPNITFDAEKSQATMNTKGDTESTTGQVIEAKGEVPDQGLILAKDDGNSGKNATTATSRLSYNTGHSDFCFSRLIDREKKKIEEIDTEEDRKWFAGITGSTGVPFVELDGFKRYKSSHHPKAKAFLSNL